MTCYREDYLITAFCFLFFNKACALFAFSSSKKYDFTCSYLIYWISSFCICCVFVHYGFGILISFAISLLDDSCLQTILFCGFSTMWPLPLTQKKQCQKKNVLAHGYDRATERPSERSPPEMLPVMVSTTHFASQTHYSDRH